MKVRQLAIISFLFSFSIAGIGQGMTIHAGASSMKTNLSSLTFENTAHTGYLIGADGRLGDDGFYFMIGLQYHKLNFVPSDSFSFQVDDSNFDILKGKGGLAFRIFQINDHIQTRIRLMGAIDFLLATPDLDATDNPANLVFNEGVAGLIGGLEMDIYFLTLNVEYQKGFFKSVQQTADSSMDFITMSLGVNF